MAKKPIIRLIDKEQQRYKRCDCDYIDKRNTEDKYHMIADTQLGNSEDRQRENERDMREERHEK